MIRRYFIVLVRWNHPLKYSKTQLEKKNGKQTAE